jgi:hypothetical protein
VTKYNNRTLFNDVYLFVPFVYFVVQNLALITLRLSAFA